MSKPRSINDQFKHRVVLVCVGLLLLISPLWAQSLGSELDPRLTVEASAENYPGAQTVYLLDDLTFVVEPDRSHSLEEHNAIKILHSDGIESNRRLLRMVDITTTEIEIISARTVKADGRVINSPKPTYTAGGKENQTYENLRLFSLEFPDLQVGDTVEFHLRTTYQPKPGGHFWSATFVQNPIPLKQATFTFIVPEDVPYQTNTPGHPETQATETLIERDGVTYKHLHWKMGEEPSYEYPPLSPPALTLLKRVEVSSFMNWSEVAEYLQSDWDANHKVSDSILLRTAGWLPTVGDTGARAAGLIRELNRKRQVVGTMTHQPEFHSPEKLLDRETLFSSDISLLTSVVLSAAGIENIPVLILGFDSDILSKELPTPEKIEQVVLQVPRPGKDPLWFDPQNPSFLLHSAPPKAQGTVVFSWDSRFGTKDPVELKPSLPFNNREELVLEGRIEKNGRGEFSVQYDHYGQRAIDFRNFARELQEGPRETKERMLDSLFQNATRSFGQRARLITRFFEPDPDAVEPITLAFTVAVPGAGQLQDDILLVPLPRFLSSSVRSAARGYRQDTPLVFGEPNQLDVRIHLIFPKGSEVLNAADPIRYQTPEFELVVESRVHENEVWYVGNVTVNDPWVGSDRLEAVLEGLKLTTGSEDTILKVRLPEIDTDVDIHDDSDDDPEER